MCLSLPVILHILHTCKEQNPSYIISYDSICNSVLQTREKMQINFTEIHLPFPKPGRGKAICNLLYHTSDIG